MGPSITLRDAPVNTRCVRHLSRGVNNGDMDFASNLKRLRKHAGMTQEALALACSWPGQSRISNYESGTRAPTLADADLLAKALNVTRPELLGDTLPVMEDDGHVMVTCYKQAVGLGDGVEAEEYAETHKLKFRADSLTRKRLKTKDLAVFYGKGDSMEPRIHSGDAVLFDQSDTRPRDGHLYVILVPGAGAETYSVKRCELIEDMVLFKSDNPKGDHGWTKPRRMDDPRKPIKIIGRVRWIGSWEG
jgi:phage repressor protein C with HTH and peptisase S24 domain